MKTPLHLTRAVLALDPGGSKCDAVLTSEDGTVIGSSRVQEPGLGGRSENVILEAAKTAIGTCTFDELHVTSYSRIPRAIYDLAGGALVRDWLISEQEGVLALMGQKAGIVVVAGTGNRVSARTHDGRQLSLDGLGPFLGDYGSGYSIGREGLRAATRAFMHRRHGTSMKHRLLAAFVDVMSGANNPEKFAVLSSLISMQEGSPEELRLLNHSIWFSLVPQDRSAVAAMAKIVNEEAEKGDAVAIRILEEAADELAVTLWDLLDRLQIANEEYLLVGTGSIAQKSDIFWNHFCGLTYKMAPHITPVRSSGAAVVGNAAYVWRELLPQCAEAIRKKLLSTPYPPIESSPL